MKRLLFFVFFTGLIFATGCAKRGTINGGLKDTIPPALIGSSPENYSTGFTGNTIKLTFNEYVKLKDVNKNLVISPPMERAPDISPTAAGKVFTIKIKDTLNPNTTYSLNFGQSIRDNNEGNPFNQFKYVFSTGTYIDSLQLGGTIKDAHDKKTDNFVSVMLYEVDKNYTDSIIYKKPPRYITNTLDSLKLWKIDNIKAGKYLLIALKDNNNNKYDPKSDKIAFRKQFISIPNDTLFQLDLYKENGNFKSLKPLLDSGQKLLMPFEGNAKEVKVIVKNGSEVVPSVLTSIPEKDSLNIWFKPIKVDSLQISISKGEYHKDFYSRIKPQKRDSLSFKAVSPAILTPRSIFKVESSIPISSIDKSKISVFSKDSTAVLFETNYDELEKRVSLVFKNEESQKYTIKFLPGALTDFYGSSNDTLKYAAATQALSAYANLRIELKNVKRYPYILEITNDKGDVKAFESRKEKELDPETKQYDIVNFNGIDPAVYTLRFIYDDNGNGAWDSGNFLQKRQPEEVIYFPKPLDVHENWDVDQEFTLP